jgi:hypothetical protein
MFNSSDTHISEKQHSPADPSAKLGDQPLVADTPAEPSAEQDPANGPHPPPANVLAEAAAPAMAYTTLSRDGDPVDAAVVASAAEVSAAPEPGNASEPTPLELAAEAAAAAREAEEAQRAMTTEIRAEDAETAALLPSPLQDSIGRPLPDAAAPSSGGDMAATEPLLEGGPAGKVTAVPQLSNGVASAHTQSGERPADGAFADEAQLSGPASGTEAAGNSSHSSALAAAAAASGNDTKAGSAAADAKLEVALPQRLSVAKQRLLDWHWANLEYGCSARLSEARRHDCPT